MTDKKKSIVSAALYPGVANCDKLIYRLFDLASTEPGTEINIAGSGEVALFADFPVSIRFGDTDRVMENMTEIRWIGDVEKIYVKRPASTFGRLVIYSGNPLLGPGFSREDPEKKLTRCTRTSMAWAGSTAELDVYSFSLPATAKEAYYYGFVCLERTGGGTITGIEIVDTETGTAWIYFRDLKANPAANYCYYFPRMLRVATAHKLRVIGSSEAGASTLYRSIGVVEI